MVSPVAVARVNAGYLTIGAVGDHVLALTDAGVDTLPPGEHRLALVALHLEVKRVLVLILQWTEPHRLPVVIDDHRAVLTGPVFLGAVLRGNKNVAWGGMMRLRGHVNGGRAKVRARAEGPC